MTWKLHKLIGSLAKDRRGAALLYVSMLLPVLIGGGLLAVDAARLFNLQTSLQEGADALALAGAAELDRRPAFGGAPSSIQRAINAINNLVQNQSRFGTGGLANVTVDWNNTYFLSSLPQSDTTPIDHDPSAGFVTTDPREARYVEVTVTPTTMNTIFPVTYLGGASNQATMSAVAVAGLDVGVCQFTPMYLCNPYEGNPTTTIYNAVGDPAIRRHQIRLKIQGGAAGQNGPGNYGFLMPPGGDPGANALRDMLAVVSPPTCFVQNGVLVRTGSIASLRDGINVRFDLYNGPLNSKKSNASYRPARNVRKGWDPGGGSGCSQTDQTATSNPNNGYSKLPRDQPLILDPNLRIGDGNWNCQSYWNTNFSATPSVTAPTGCTSSSPTISRYELYRYEIDNNLVSHPSTNPSSPERGTPACYTGGTLNDTPDRRLLYAAIINCQQYAADLVGGSGDPIPVETFAKFFLTEPMTTPDLDMYAELTGLVDPAADPGIVHDLVQLYR